MTKYLKYDKKGIAKPKAVVDRLRKCKEDGEEGLAVTDCYNIDDGDEPLFEEAIAELNILFDKVLVALTEEIGTPDFHGDDKNKKYPFWAGTGYRVAFWKEGKQITYLHITHVGSVAPVELNLGVVTGPPKNWVIGT